MVENIGEEKIQELELLLDSLRVGDGVEINTGHPGRDSVVIGKVDEKSLTDSDSRNHQIQRENPEVYDTGRKILGLAESRGIGLKHYSTADWDGPTSELYIVEYITGPDGGISINL